MIRHQCPICKGDIEYTEKYDDKTNNLAGKQPIYFPLKDRHGNWQPKNLFKIRLFTLLFIVIILFMSWGYHEDTQVCHNITYDICASAERAGCYDTFMLSNAQGEKQIIRYDEIKIP